MLAICRLVVMVFLACAVPAWAGEADVIRAKVEKGPRTGMVMIFPLTIILAHHRMHILETIWAARFNRWAHLLFLSHVFLLKLSVIRSQLTQKNVLQD